MTKSAQVNGNAKNTIQDGRAEPSQRAEELATLAQRVEALEAQLQMARGTREIARVAAPASVSPLYTSTETLLSERPHTFRELCMALKIDGEQENSLKSIIVRLQRDGKPIVNLGNGSRAIWWIDVHDRIGAIAAGKSRTMSSKR